MKPNERNFCGGAFPDWLEVNLIDLCNGRCSWCIERDGYHPQLHVPWNVLADKIVGHSALNIILLGGEPTLFRDIDKLITRITHAGKHVWITTNGSRLYPEYVSSKLQGIYGINLSIHHYDMEQNFDIVGVHLDRQCLVDVTKLLHEMGASVRLNCNCMKGYVDSIKTIEDYIEFAKRIGADKIRFAELKQDDDDFVDLARILNYKYGLNDSPFTMGCNSDAVIDGMQVNFRQMCGLQTTRRVRPDEPEGIMKEVLYYDGIFYNGWQIIKKEEQLVNSKEVIAILNKVKTGEIDPKVAAELLLPTLDNATPKQNIEVQSGGDGYCQY